jgi:hypothetical protein
MRQQTLHGQLRNDSVLRLMQPRLVVIEQEEIVRVANEARRSNLFLDQMIDA